MNEQWQCGNTLVTKASHDRAWKYMSDMRHLEEMENVKIELDGPFQSGTKGRTVTADAAHEWELRDVEPPIGFSTVGRDGDFELTFRWEFQPHGTGTKLSQTISAVGTSIQMDKWRPMLKEMETNSRTAVKDLAARLDAFSAEAEPHS